MNVRWQLTRTLAFENMLSFFAFLRMSNVAPHSSKSFDHNRHLLRQDVIFGPPGAHIILKWTKTLQDSRAHHIVQIPLLPNSPVCPVSAIQVLLQSRKFPSDYPLFVKLDGSIAIDTYFRDALRLILTRLGMSHAPHGFHTLGDQELP